MKSGILTTLLLPVLLFTSCISEYTGKAVKQGFADLKSFDLQNRTIRLDGDWEFYWNKLYSPADLIDAENHRSFITVPAVWNDQNIDNHPLPGHGFATYRTRVAVAATGIYGFLIPPVKYSYKMWMNGTLVAEGGKTGESASATVPSNVRLLRFVHVPDNEFTLTIQAANFVHERGGFAESLLFGKQESILLKNDSLQLMDAFLFGILLVMGLYHLTIFFQRHQEQSSLYFGLFSVLIAVRIILMGTGLVYKAFPAFPYDWALKIEYLTYYLGLSVFLTYISHLLKGEFNRYVLLAFQALALIFSAVVLVTPVHIFSYTLVPYQIITLAGIIVLGYVFFKSVRDKKTGTKTSILGVMILITTVINDILYDHQLVPTGYLAPFGLALFIFVQSYTLARLYALAFKAVETLAGRLTNTNDAYRRFVPQEFLSLLKKDDITRVKLGDQINKTMSIMFADIRSFTSISEKMSPEDNFNFINTYLKQIGPIIRKHQGFIDKYIGDSIMALFPDTVDEALAAALEIQDEVYNYNQAMKKNADSAPIKIGIGINTGNLMLGIIGEDERMDGTVISDTVNIASRLEGLTKIYDAKIIISEATLELVNDKSRFLVRKIDRVNVKGKSLPVSIYEVFNNDIEEVKNLKIQTLTLFDEGVNHYLQEQYDLASEIFQKISKINPGDKVIRMLIEKSAIKFKPV